MLDLDERTSVFTLKAKGLGTRAIAKALKRSRNQVREVLRSGQKEVPPLRRAELLDRHGADIEALFVACKGNRIRVFEELQVLLAAEAAKEGQASSPALAYSTLTSYCRRHKIGKKPRKPSGTYSFALGEEMQFDTSPHWVEIAGQRRLVQTASLVSCGSRRMFIQAYPTFNRFYARVFLTEAIQALGGASGRCVVDNSSVVVARGTGKNAVFQPELQALADLFGFSFMAHELGDANRSARVERPFDYIENNFHAGRTFASLDDLNERSREWCLAKADRRELDTLDGLTPESVHPKELPHLQPLPVHIPEVYESRSSTVDIYGFVHLDRSRYSMPFDYLDRKLTVLKGLKTVRVFDRHQLVTTHPRFLEWERGQSVLPEHRPVPGQRGRWARVPTPHEEELRAAGAEFAKLLDLLGRRHGGRAVRSMRRLHRMYVDYPTAVLRDAIRAALDFGLSDLDRLERMVLHRIRGDFFQLSEPDNEEDPPWTATSPSCSRT